jgi:hypothetical protein
VVESFFNVFNRERIRRRTYRTRDEASQDVLNYIEMFYNPERKHVRNGVLSPSSSNGDTKSNPKGSTERGAVQLDLRESPETVRQFPLLILTSPSSNAKTPK